MVLVVLALILRLAWQPPIPAVDAIAPDLAALYGDHALCLAAAAGQAPAPLHQDRHSGDVEHGFAGCCAWHAGSLFVLPQTLSSARLVYGSATRLAAAEPERPPPIFRSTGQARAPPETI